MDAGDGKRVLYDPGGAFAYSRGGGSGDALYDGDADLVSYIKFHQRNGERIRLQTIETDKKTDMKIIQNVDEQGGGAAFFAQPELVKRQGTRSYLTG